jgi:hypothetical protein
VELSFTERFELHAGDADVLIQLRGRDVMWQKERLLNLALARLPGCCDQVAWIDGDVLFGDDAWPAAASAALTSHAVIQPFRESYDLRRDAGTEALDPADLILPCQSLGWALERGEVNPDLLLAPDKTRLGIRCGLAWAARREVLDRHGFYDACIMGCGDGAIIAAALGKFDDLIAYLEMNANRVRHYRRWAVPFHATVLGDIGSCAGTLYHLWHGELEDRHYLARRIGFARFDFDPEHDLAEEDNGCWRWSSAKPAMHRFVRDYFFQRNEDGVDAAADVPLRV